MERHLRLIEGHGFVAIPCDAQADDKTCQLFELRETSNRTKPKLKIIAS